MASPKLTDRQCEELFRVADAAGHAAAQAATVGEYVVYDADPLSGAYNGGNIYRQSGTCGFAWVNIKPGNCKFANWLKKNRVGRTDSYYKGVSVWISEFGQCMEQKEAYAGAFAAVIRDAGFEKVYSMSRMD